MTRADRVTDALTHHGEGPVWIEGTHWPDGLYWVDMLAGDVLALTADGEVTRRDIAQVCAVIRPRTNGGLVYAIERGFALDDGPGTPLVRLPEIWSDPGVRMNEGGCDPVGRFWCGSMAFEKTPGAGVLYVLDVDHGVRVVERGLTIPNGLAWSADGTRVFHIDTPTGGIDLLEGDGTDGPLRRRRFADVSGGAGPDGLCLDAEGGVWVAVWGAGAVHRYDADGALSAVVEVPVSQVSACTFGGPDLDRLYITTSRDELADPEPDAGALYAVDPGVRGLPVRPYAG